MKSGSRARRGFRALLLSLAFLVLGFAGLIRFAYTVDPYGTKVGLDRIHRLANNGQIIWAKLLDEDSQVIGQVCSVPTTGDASRPIVPSVPTGASAPTRCSGTLTSFRAAYPRSNVSTQELIERISFRAPVEVDNQTPKAIAKLVITFVFPLLILANLFGIIFLSRGNDSSIADIIGFGRIGRSRERKRRSETGVTFADVAGADEAVAELREVSDYLTDPTRFESVGAAAPKGVLLFGAPGCGKTLLSRAVAGESGVPFFSISGAEFVESLVGVGAARVRDLFRQVRDVAPAIVFIDEIDAVGRRRGGEGASGGEREQTVNQLLVEMDGFEVSSGIVIIGATNRPDILDPALLRPGRFDRHVTLEPPDVHGREAILQLHSRGKPINSDVDFAAVARATPGFTGADLANVINAAALLTIRQGVGREIRSSQVTEAVQRVLHGPQRRGTLMTAEERQRIAIHESGHAIVAVAVGRRADLQRVSIVARGRGLGQSVVSTDQERVLFTRSEMEAKVTIAMGGIAAEELHFGECSTTAEDDIDKATETARHMVGRFGMSAGIGRHRILGKENGGYLGGDGLSVELVSGPTLHEFDQEVTALIRKAELTATALLLKYRDELEAMADKLQEEETLDSSALEALVAGVTVEPTEPDDHLTSIGDSRPQRRQKKPVQI